MLKIRIKASPITNLTDARYFAALGVEWLGFSLDPASQYYLPPIQLNAIREWVEGPKVVGEFGLQETEEIVGATKLLALDVVQVSQYVNVHHLKQQVELTVIQEQVIENLKGLTTFFEEINKAKTLADIYLVDFDKNGIGWEQLSTSDQFSKLLDCAAQQKIILSLANISVAEIEAISNTPYIYGVQLRGGAEEKPGLKSFDELDEIFDALVED